MALPIVVLNPCPPEGELESHMTFLCSLVMQPHAFSCTLCSVTVQAPPFQ